MTRGVRSYAVRRVVGVVVLELNRLAQREQPDGEDVRAHEGLDEVVTVGTGIARTEHGGNLEALGQGRIGSGQRPDPLDRVLPCGQCLEADAHMVIALRLDRQLVDELLVRPGWLVADPSTEPFFERPLFGSDLGDEEHLVAEDPHARDAVADLAPDGLQRPPCQFPFAGPVDELGVVERAGRLCVGHMPRVVNREPGGAGPSATPRRPRNAQAGIEDGSQPFPVKGRQSEPDRGATVVRRWVRAGPIALIMALAVCGVQPICAGSPEAPLQRAAAQLLREVPLPPGDRPVSHLTSALLQHPASSIGCTPLVDKARFMVVSGTLQSVSTFLKRHHPQRWAVQGSGGSVEGATGKTSYDVIYVPWERQRRPQPELVVTYAVDGKGESGDSGGRRGGPAGRTM